MKTPRVVVGMCLLNISMNNLPMLAYVMKKAIFHVTYVQTKETNKIKTDVYYTLKNLHFLQHLLPIHLYHKYE